MSLLPVEEAGYGLGNLVLNQRIGYGDGGSRVPDILFAGTHVGLNYDGGATSGWTTSSRQRERTARRRSSPKRAQKSWTTSAATVSFCSRATR